MHKVTFFPIGNADTCQIDLAGGEKLLFDYCHRKNPNESNDRRIDLAAALREDLRVSNRNDYDVVGFTHLDDDHIHGSTSFFWLRHHRDYQGEGRAKIGTLWVPAAVIVEDECDGEAAVIQAEARYRLKQKSGIRVFSRPDALKDWLRKEGMTLDEVSHLITDAGQLVPGWTKERQGVEFFVHSPFAARMDNNEVVDRNNDALFLQATFSVYGVDTRLILSADVDSDVIEEIVRITRDVKKRPERLAWDINNVPHHSSYRSLNKDEKGKDRTSPPEKVDWLYRQGGKFGYLVSTSDQIPPNDDSDQPPHRQAAAYYEERVRAISGEYRVTMEYPSASRPAEMVFEITSSGARLKKRAGGGAVAAVSAPARRAGAAYCAVGLLCVALMLLFGGRR